MKGRRSKGVTIIAVLLILYILYAPLRTARFFVAALTDSKLQLSGQKSLVTNKASGTDPESAFGWKMVTFELKKMFFQLDRLKPLRLSIDGLRDTLPIYLSQIPQRLDLVLTGLILLINCSLLVSASALLLLKRNFLKVLYITAGVIMAINVLNILFAIPMLSQTTPGILTDVISSAAKLIFFGIVIYFFTRAEVKEQFN